MEKAIAYRLEDSQAYTVTEEGKSAVVNIHQSLIDSCREGSREAQYQLYKLYNKAMLNVAWRIVNNQSDAEDILQESFLSAFRNIQSYKGDATFGAWLKRIVVNKAINHIRKRKLEMSDQEIGEVDVADEQNSVENDPEVLLSVERIKRAIPQLPDGFRAVLSLYLLEGYDHREIADILGITESTSKSQFNRAKSRLREILKSEVNYE
ncbi:sigma-70 family RNA polymerase sigma factor [uncultured Imperialibacter sp.]|uniref:RNA polymerase sigma factor n=1 Tax=uncultured Imperialibacter sp. TaxID=1672639 RepID=UPI0030DC5A3E